MTDDDVLKILRRLKKHVVIETDDGWTLESDKRRVRPTTLEFKYVVDHHQASGHGTIQRVDFETMTVASYIGCFCNSPEYWQRGDKLGVNIWRSGKNVEILCEPNDVLLVENHRHVTAVLTEPFKTIKKAVECALSYDGC